MKTSKLYREIMASVSKEVKRALLEAEYSNFDFNKNRKDSISRIEDREEEEDELTWKHDADLIKKIEKQAVLRQIIDKVINDDPLSAKDKATWHNNIKDIEPFYVVEDKENLQYIIRVFIDKLGSRVNLNWIDTSNITDMSGLFHCSLFEGDISKWDVSNVENMSRIFKLAFFNGDISNWDVSNVKDMSGMFYCSMFKKDISNWDVSNVEDMSFMFYDTDFNGDISKWDVSNVVNMSLMFEDSKFNSDISKWDVSNVKDAWHMFKDSKFKKDISCWKINCELYITYRAFDELPKKYRPKSYED